MFAAAAAAAVAVQAAVTVATVDTAVTADSIAAYFFTAIAAVLDAVAIAASELVGSLAEINKIGR